MSMQIFRGVTVLLFTLLLAPYAYADPPGGQYEVSFDDHEKAVWDVTGTYQINDLGAITDFTLVQDDKGKVTGQGTITGSEQGLDILLNFTATGALTAVAGEHRLSLNVKQSGTATDGVKVYAVRGNLRLALTVDDSTHELSGTTKGSICVIKVGCEKISDTLDLTIPASEDGTWKLALDINGAVPNKLTGIGTVTLKNGRAEVFSLKGSYVPGNDMTKLTLKGTAGSFNLQTHVIGSVISIDKMTAKILGQSVKLP